MREFKSPDEKHAYLARLVAGESLRRLYNSLWLDDSPQYKCGERMPRITTSERRLANLFSVSIVPPTTEEEAERRAEVAASRIDSMVRQYLSIREPILPDIPENGYRVSDRGWACDCVYGGDTWRLFFMAETRNRCTIESEVLNIAFRNLIHRGRLAGFSDEKIVKLVDGILGEGSWWSSSAEYKSDIRYAVDAKFARHIRDVIASQPPMENAV